MSQPPKQLPGPPYPAQTAGIGGEPTTIPDVPVFAVFMAIYLAFGVTNIVRFNLNRRKKPSHLFVPSIMMGGFSMSRVLTCALRIGWSQHHSNISLALTAQIFVNIGILLFYIINIMLAQRILRAKQPKFGWNPAVKTFLVAAYAGIAIAIIMVIVMIVYSAYTLRMDVHTDAKWIERGALTYLFLITILPLILLGLAFGLPRSEETQPFGKSSFVSKTIILVLGTCLCITLQGYKIGVFWSPPRPVTDPAWYDSKPAFYCFQFVIEIVILIIYTFSRIDHRFFVPNGSHKRRSYIEPKGEDTEEVNDIESAEKVRDSD